MKLFAVAALLCLAPEADAFVVAPPIARVSIAGRSAARQYTTMVSPLPAAASTATTLLQASVVPLLAAGAVAEPGTVDAPGWVLPAGAAAVVLMAGVIPLALKVRVCVCVRARNLHMFQTASVMLLHVRADIC